jgi:hypothetical protein
MVLFRTRSLHGRWSAWHRAMPGEDDLPDRGTEGVRGWRIGAPFWTGGSNGIQYRTIGLVRHVRAFFVRGSGGSPVRVRRSLMTETPTIITRSQWHANEAIRRGEPRYADNVHVAIVHHTAGSNSYTASQSAGIVRAIEIYHVQGNGWNDIGYNFLVDKYGQVFEGRYGGMTRAVIGAHAMGFNVGSVGIALIGNYNTATVTPAARAALISLLAWRLDLAHVDPRSRVVRISTGNPRYPPGTAVTLNAISGHRDTYQTSCPGSSLYAQLPAIRRAVGRTGLPKIYEPAAVGSLGGPVRFTARLSAASGSTVTVRDGTGAVVASGSGSGTRVDWTWDSSGADPNQRYAWTIAVPEARSATGAIGKTAPVELQQVRVVPTVVTPADRPKLTYRLTAPSFVTATLVDAAGNVVATLLRKNQRAGRKSIPWPAGMPAEGHYRLSLLARDTVGQTAEASVPVTVDWTLGSFASSATAFVRRVELSFDLAGTAYAQLRIVSGLTTIATLVDGELNAGSQSFEWNAGGVAEGRYRAVLTVTDTLASVTRSRPLRVDRTGPVLRLLSFRSLRFWLSEPARVTLVLNGRARRLTLRRGGAFRVGYPRTVRSLRVFAVDAAGNRSRIIRARR